MGSLPRPGKAVLVPWLGMLSLIAAAAVVRALLLPNWPRAEELPAVPFQQALARAGLQASLLPARPARRREPLALSSQLGWRLDAGAQLWIVRGSVRRYEDLQASFLARPIPELRLAARRLEQPVSGSAAGLIQGHPALQTCLVPQSDGPAVAGVTRNALLRASDPRRQLSALRDPRTLGDPAALAASLSTLLGPRSFSCILVTLRSDDARPLPEDLWTRLLPSLQAALQPAERR